MEIAEIKRILNEDFENKKVGPATRERMKLGPGLDWCANYITHCIDKDKISFSAARGHLESVLCEMGFGPK